jgi:hypothetical protein
MAVEADIRIMPGMARISRELSRLDAIARALGEDSRRVSLRAGSVGEGGDSKRAPRDPGGGKIMRVIQIKISDEDFDHVVRHFARERIGRPMVAVVACLDPISAEAIEEERCEIEQRKVRE